MGKSTIIFKTILINIKQHQKYCVSTKHIHFHFLNYKRFSVRKLHKKAKLVMSENTNELTIKNNSTHSNIVYTSVAPHPSSPCP